MDARIRPILNPTRYLVKLGCVSRISSQLLAKQYCLELIFLETYTSFGEEQRSPLAMSPPTHVHQTSPPSPPLEHPTVSLHALSGGYFSLPEYQFIHPVPKDSRKTVPSLAFLIQHRDITTRKLTRIVFDLGVRRDIGRYAEPIRKHVTTRQPMVTEPDVVQSLAKGGLTPEDIDYVIYSHVSHSS